MVRDPLAEEAYEQVASRGRICELGRLLERVDARERTVIEVHFGLRGKERTLRQLGEALGVSAERVRQIERSALEKMRAVHSDSPIAA
jgi:RNA polymerase primary sigma factor